VRRSGASGSQGTARNVNRVMADMDRDLYKQLDLTEMGK
jgi:hypothetical protein